MKIFSILFVLVFLSVEHGRTQTTPYLNTGLSLNFGFDRNLYITPKLTVGYASIENRRFINATISYSYSWKSNSFWNIYSEYSEMLAGVGGGISIMKKDGMYINSFRGNIFGGLGFYLNYVHHSRSEFPDNIGLEYSQILLLDWSVIAL